MTTVKELEAQLAELQATLAQNGIFAPKPARATDKDRKDRIDFSSPEHLTLLGLIEMAPGDKDISLFITRKSQGKTYRLEDEVTAFMHYPDPKQIAALVLRSKISEFNAGKPPRPSFAEAPMWTPDPMDGAAWEQKQVQVMA